MSPPENAPSTPPVPPPPTPPPRLPLSFMAPSGGFRVVKRSGRTVMAPEGHTRYDGVARAVASVDAKGVQRVYQELTSKGALYAYADPRLEALGAAEKHLLRMGPDNMRKVQAKLSEIASALGLPSPEQARQP